MTKSCQEQVEVFFTNINTRFRVQENFFNKINFINIENKLFVACIENGYDNFDEALDFQKFVLQMRSVGHRLIVLHRDRWEAKSPIVEGLITNLLNKNKTIYAREASVFELETDEYADFLNHNHVLGYTHSKYRYALCKHGKILCVAGFSSPLWMKNEPSPYYSTELIRYSSKIGTNVAGGLSKIIHYFQNHIKTDEIMTYIDIEWASGSSFFALGFRMKQITKPLAFSLQNGHRIRSNKGDECIYNLGNLKLSKKNL